MKDRQSSNSSAFKICRCAALAVAAVTAAEAFAPQQHFEPLQAEQQDGASSLWSKEDLFPSTSDLLKIAPQRAANKLQGNTPYTPIEAPSPALVKRRRQERTGSTPPSVSSSPSSSSANNRNSKSKINLNTTKRKTIKRPTLDSELTVKPKNTNSNMKNKKGKQTSPHGTAIKKANKLLTFQQEMDYCFRIRTYRAATQLRDQLVHRDLETGIYVHPSEADWAAACGCTIQNLRRLVEEGQQARAALVAANAGLVVQQAQRHHAGLKYATEAGGGVGTILTLQDMIQEGNLGLMEAAERFQPEKGFRFSTYATYWVRQRILRSVTDSSRTIRLPVHVHDMLQRMRKAKLEYKSLTGNASPSLAELAHYMEVPEHKLRQYTASSRNVVSLERPVDATKASTEDDRRTLGDTLASDAPTPEEDAVQDSLRREIRAVLDAELAHAERQVLTCRFGLNNVEQPLTVSETAAKLGLSRDRVRLYEARALNKLRHPQRNYRLKEYIAHNSAAAAADLAHEEEQELSDYSSALEETFANSPSETTSTASADSGPPRPDRLWFF